MLMKIFYILFKGMNKMNLILCLMNKIRFLSDDVKKAIQQLKLTSHVGLIYTFKWKQCPIYFRNKYTVI